jgi:hypothetical protein
MRINLREPSSRWIVGDWAAFHPRSRVAKNTSKRPRNQARCSFLLPRNIPSDLSEVAEQRISGKYRSLPIFAVFAVKQKLGKAFWQSNPRYRPKSAFVKIEARAILRLARSFAAP